MNKTKYIRTSSGSMIPIYPHPADNKNSSQAKPPNLKTPKKAAHSKASNSEV